MQKILEIKDFDWLKGQSAQVNIPMDGLFKSTSNTDPFEQGGISIPSLSPATQALSTTSKFLTSFNDSGTDYLYAHTDTKLYRVLKDSPYTVSDQTAQINQTISGNFNKILGRAKWKSGYVYAFATDTANAYVKYNSFPVASGNDVTLITNPLVTTASLYEHIPFCVGADGNLYMGNYNRINVFTSATGTTGNTTYYFIDDGFVARDIVNDGRYLVIIADNNVLANSSRRVGSYQCRVYFWDMVKTDATPRIVPDAMFDINDSYLTAAKILDGNIYIFGYNGLYVTNVATSPKLIRSFPTTTTSSLLVRPLNSSQVAVSKGSIFWADGINSIGATGQYNPDIYAYGNPITGQQKIFYRPYTTGVNQLPTCLLWSGNNLIVGTDTPNLNFFNVGTTRGTQDITTISRNLEQPYTYGFTKVALATKLTTGQSVTVIAYRDFTNQIISTETISYSASNPKQTLMFRKVPSSNSPDKFSDITLTIRSTGASIARVSTYATPLADSNEDI